MGNSDSSGYWCLPLGSFRPNPDTKKGWTMVEKIIGILAAFIAAVLFLALLVAGVIGSAILVSII